MAVTSGFFNAKQAGTDEQHRPIYDRTYDASNFSEYFSSLIGNGISAAIKDCFKVIAFEGMKIQVLPGFAWIDGYYFKSTSNITLTVPTVPVPVSESIIHAVVIKLDRKARTIGAELKLGDPATVPQIPQLSVSGTEVTEIMLAYITLSSGDSKIDSSKITDTRGNEEVCGIINTFSQKVLPNGSVDHTKLAPNSVGTENLMADCVTEEKIQPEAITTLKIAPNAITEEKIKDSSVSSSKLAKNAVTNEYTATISNTSWSLVSTQGYYECDTSVVGLLSMYPFILAFNPDGLNLQESSKAKEDFSLIVDSDCTSNNLLHLKAAKKPKGDIPVKIMAIKR